MPLLSNIGRLVACRDEGTQADVHAIEGAALAWEGDSIVWIGAEAELPARFRAGGDTEPAETIDANGALVVPGLIDCHTHLAFAGDRSDEFEQRLFGVDYLEIARQGGGIQNTVRATRAASSEELVAMCRRRLERMVRRGVTTVECKSGYGLSVEQELRLLGVYREVAKRSPVRLTSTFLGAHVPGPEYLDNRDGYVDLVVEQMIPRVAAEGLADFCDVFVEEGAFTGEQTRRIARVADEHGLRMKLHVDQLGDGGGAALAAELRAVSADHLEYASLAGIDAMAEADVVAVSLPLATLFLRQTFMPARRFLEAGARVAVATDYNPGTAPSDHLPLAMLLASVQHGMSAAEVLKGATMQAAHALGRQDQIGSLEPGKKADFVVLDAADERSWLFRFHGEDVLRTVIGGRTVWSR